jgi:protein NRD1
MNWAVGFGPTKYADYKKGESVLPIDVLTDADRKWMKTAEFGGTGGLEIATGMVVEEPDIEIGAGPSSKGMFKSWRYGVKGSMREMY